MHAGKAFRRLAYRVVDSQDVDRCQFFHEIVLYVCDSVPSPISTIKMHVYFRTVALMPERKARHGCLNICDCDSNDATLT
jgi:hypothetical protein